MDIKIYYLHKGDNIPFYVGKTNNINSRISGHRIKYGKNIFIETIKEVSSKEWKLWEKYYIILYKNLGFVLLNKNEGGGGPTTIIFDEERNKKIGDKNRGMNKSHKGRPFTQEHKNKIKAKRDHLIGRKNIWLSRPVIQCNLEGNFIKEWSSQKEAQEFFNKAKSDGIGACCRNEQKTAYGYKWKYK